MEKLFITQKNAVLRVLDESLSLIDTNVKILEKRYLIFWKEIWFNGKFRFIS